MLFRSLFNALVKARSYVADQLFATLDTTTRQLYLGERQSGDGSEGADVDGGQAGQGGSIKASLSDTVGFIRDLPHGLIDAFEATLQEAAQASLLVHVVDASDPEVLEQIAQVQTVLAEIGAQHVPQVLVFNKLDALEKDRWPDRKSVV